MRFFLISLFLLFCEFSALEIPADQLQNGEQNAQNFFIVPPDLPPNEEAKENCLPENAFCARNALSPQCLRCDFPSVCPFGDSVVVNCTPSAAFVNCAGDGVVPRANVSAVVRLQAKCRFCWQLEQSEIVCEERKNCSTNELTLHRTKCRAKPNAICAGRRHFFKNVRCHWTSGHSWRKALFLSVTLGGFGVDRFYLGHWKSAIGKLFSFGGLGVWTLLDIVLIAFGYIQPADESLYI
ncbi:hypothetical protein niasHS_007186 [Heterodera schachtii]|uniref:TM2 domain-containing protein n=1 Tax=Heterodera schachtii TaxID=97005 RepID=A0ABD2JJL8_HETSC